MWICLNDAFVSAVADPTMPGMLKVRARKREHLAKLFPANKIHGSSRTDYGWRVIVTKEAFADLVAGRIHGIEYDNFKDSVVDDKLHDLYADMWTLHWEYQHGWHWRKPEETVISFT
jgi:hypothetical protein